MIAASVLMVAFAYRVGHIAEAVSGVNVSYETLLLPTVWAAEFTGLVACESLGL